MRVTEHNGFVIDYDENADVWRVVAPLMEATTLSALRTKIDEAARAERRLSVKALRLVSGGYDKPPEVQTVTVTLLAAPSSGPATEAYIKDAKGERSKVRIASLYPDTPEARAAIIAFLAASKEKDEATERERVARLAIPAFSALALIEAHSLADPK